MKKLKMSGNWVDGDQFFDRETELRLLRERVEDGTHTLLTAQRRMGKTSLVRELLRQLGEEERFDSVFVDLEAAMDAADAVAEMAARARPLQPVGARLRSWLSAGTQDALDSIEEIGISHLKLRLRQRLDAGNWRRIGDEVFEAFAANDRPVVLALDELPILVNRLLKGHEHGITSQRLAAADEFMSWLRRCAQAHRDRVCLILSGSVGLEPVLSQAGLSAHANVYLPFDLKPWPSDVASDCLAALARGHGLSLPDEVREDMCRRLRCCVPHHIQRFFHHLHAHLTGQGRTEATLADVERVYEEDLLGVRGQADLRHYEDRLRTVLGEPGCSIAGGLLTEAALNGGRLADAALNVHRREASSSGGEAALDIVLDVLEHDGYLERASGGHRFVSGLMEDWWRSRYGASGLAVSRT